MTYEELWAAQVRTKAAKFAYAYSKLQHLIKRRTMAGYIHGNFSEVQGDMWDFKEIHHESDTIKVRMWVKRYPPSNTEFRINFITKR